MANSLLAVTALLFVAASAETLRAQEPPVPPELPELIGPPIYFGETSSGLETDLHTAASNYFGGGAPADAIVPTSNEFANATDSWQVQVTQILIPEPGTFVLAAIGALMLVALARQRARRRA